MKNTLKQAQTVDLKKIGEIIEEVNVGMLTTYNHGGGLCSRPMYVQEVDEDGTLWFFTSSTSHLISEIRNNPNVQVTFSSENKFVAAIGKGHEVFDRSRMQELWSPTLKTWFKDGLETQDLVLLKINLQDIEYWDSVSSPVVKVAGFTQAGNHIFS